MKHLADRCDVVYFLQPETHVAPAREFLRTAPTRVRAIMYACLTAVAEAPLDQVAGGGIWQAMDGIMSGWFAVHVNTKDRAQHRLFCLIDRDAIGRDRPLLVVIAGKTKRFGAGAFTGRDYAQIRRIGAEYLTRNPRPIC